MSGTSGGWAGTSGGRRRLGWLAMAVVALVIAAVEALSVADDAVRAGRPLDPWEPWIWEYSSTVFWIAAVPLLWAVSRRILPPRRRWAAAVPLALLAMLLLAALHFVWMGVSRPPLYALFGGSYHFEWTRAQLLYEFRKDALVLLFFLGIGVAVDRWAAAAVPVTAVPPLPPYRFAVRDGTSTRWFAATDIERVEAAGNYVELHTATGPVLHRATLAGVETELAGHGFVRIHRSRLVRAAAVTALRTTPSGDFEATLASGAQVAGSRRFRAAAAGQPGTARDTGDMPP